MNPTPPPPTLDPATLAGDGRKRLTMSQPLHPPPAPRWLRFAVQDLCYLLINEPAWLEPLIAIDDAEMDRWCGEVVKLIMTHHDNEIRSQYKAIAMPTNEPTPTQAPPFPTARPGDVWLLDLTDGVTMTECRFIRMTETHVYMQERYQKPGWVSVGRWNASARSKVGRARVVPNGGDGWWIGTVGE